MTIAFLLAFCAAALAVVLVVVNQMTLGTAVALILVAAAVMAAERSA